MDVDIDLVQLLDDVLSLKLYDELDEESLYRSKIDLVQLESLESDAVVLIELDGRPLLQPGREDSVHQRGRLTGSCRDEISCMNRLI